MMNSECNLSIFSRICTCLRFIQRAKKNPVIKYELGIDSPKSICIMSRKTLVLDLDETLVHSSFQIFDGYDFDIEIIVQGMKFKIYVIVRPGTIQFLQAMNEHYDIILWTASLKEYADPVMDRIDINRRAVKRLFRESCTLLASGLTKDLAILDLNLKDVIIIDNSENSFKLQQQNAYKIQDFFFDSNDQELIRLQPFLKWISTFDDVRNVSKHYEDFMKVSSQFPQYEEQQNLGEGTMKDTNRIQQSQRLWQKLESVTNRSPDSSRLQSNNQSVRKIMTQGKFSRRVRETSSKSMTLGHKHYNDQLIEEKQIVKEINSPHPERFEKDILNKKENEFKSTDEVESQEQTCLEEDDK